MSDYSFSPAHSPLTPESIGDLMHRSVRSIEALGIGRSRARQHTLALINRLARASLQHALYAPDHTYSRSFELKPDQSAVVKAEYYQQKWEANSAKVFGSDVVTAERVFDRPRLISYRELALQWDPIEQKCAITIERLNCSKNVILRDTFEVDLRDGAVCSHGRELSEIVGIRGDGAGKLFALEARLAIDDLELFNLPLNALLRESVKNISSMGDYYEETFCARADYLEILDQASINLTKVPIITLANLRDEISRAVIVGQLNPDSDAFDSLQSKLESARQVDAALAFDLIRGYATQYSTHYGLSDDAITTESESSLLTTDYQLFTKLQAFLGGQYADLVEYREFAPRKPDRWALAILEDEIDRTALNGAKLLVAYDQQLDAYVLSNLSESGLLEVQRVTGGTKLVIHPDDLELVDFTKAPDHKRSSSARLGQMLPIRIVDILLQRDDQSAKRIIEELGDVVISAAFDRLTHQIVYSEVRWEGPLESIRTFTRRGARFAFEVLDDGDKRLRLYHRRLEDSWIVLERLKLNGFDLLMFENQSSDRSPDFVLYRIEDRTAKLIAAQLWNVDHSMLAFAVISQLQLRHDIDAIEFPTDRSSQLFKSHRCAFENAAALGVEFVHAGRCEIRTPLLPLND